MRRRYLLLGWLLALLFAGLAAWPQQPAQPGQILPDASQWAPQHLHKIAWTTPRTP